MVIEVSGDERGRAIVAKRAEGADEVMRLRREADLLDVAAHPGLVEAVAFEDGREPVLRTRQVDGPSLAEELTLGVDEIGGVVAAVAATLADLHAMGLVHGAVAAEHVLVDGEGRPVLCSLGRGGLAGERSPAAGPDGEVLDPLDDVFGLGQVLAALLAKANGEARGASADALRRLAEQATATVPADRPTARRVADAVHDAVPGARLPRRGAADGGPPAPDPLAARRRQRPLEAWRRGQAVARGRPRRRIRVALAAVAAVGVVGAAGAAVLLLTPQPALTPPESPEAAPTPLLPPTTTVGASVPPTTTTAPALERPARTASTKANCPHADGPLTADVDADGCVEPLRFVDGFVEARGLRWAVGEAGDVVAVGDWTCSGTRSLAVLRPRTGEVFTFDGWATAERELSAPLLAQVSGARTIRAGDLDADGCNEVVVERSSGVPAVLRVPGARP